MKAQNYIDKVERAKAQTRVRTLTRRIGTPAEALAKVLKRECPIHAQGPTTS